MMNNTSSHAAADRPPIVLLGFDATEIDLIDQLIAEGRMPNLARLRRRGRWGRLQTEPPNFLSLVWSTFFCSARLGDHGWYFNKLWNPDKQQIQYVNPNWMPLKPFWKLLDDRFHVALLDVPYSAVSASGPNQVMINGWQCHDDFGRIFHPAGEWKRAVAKHGKPRLTPEVFGPQNASTLLAQRDEVIETNAQFADLVCDYLKQKRWDLLLVTPSRSSYQSI